MTSPVIDYLDWLKGSSYREKFIHSVSDRLQNYSEALAAFERLAESCPLLPSLLDSFASGSVVATHKKVRRMRSVFKRAAKTLQDITDEVGSLFESEVVRNLIQHYDGDGQVSLAIPHWKDQAKSMSELSRIPCSSASRYEALLLYWIIGHVLKMTGKQHYSELADILDVLDKQKKNVKPVCKGTITAGQLRKRFDRMSKGQPRHGSLSVMSPGIDDIDTRLDKLVEIFGVERVRGMINRNVDKSMKPEDFKEWMRDEQDLAIELGIRQFNDYLRMPRTPPKRQKSRKRPAA